jgi:signal transduction histidine kinase/PAS domain-containing protein
VTSGRETSGYGSGAGSGGAPSPVDSRSSITIFTVDVSGIITLCAGSALPEIGLAGVDAVGRRIVDTAAPWLGAAARRALDAGEASVATGRTAGRWYECSCLPQRTEAGALAGFAGWVADVTERERIERAREEQEHLLRAVDVIIWKMNAADLRIVYATGALFLLGRPEREWTDAPSFFSEVCHPAERQSTLGVIRSVAEDRVERRCVHRAIAADGRTLWFRTRLRPSIEEPDAALQITGVMVDITGNLSAEETMRGTESHLRRLLDQLPAVVFTTDRELRFTSGVGQELKELGVRSQTVLGGVFVHEYLQVGRNDPALTPHRRALEGESLSYESEWVGRHYQSFVSPFRDANGEIIGTLAVSWNISARKHVEDTVRLLSEASLILASSLDYDETLARIARLAVPRLGDWCIVGVMEDHELRLVAATHVDPSQEPLFAAMLQPTKIEALGEIGRVMLTQKSLLVARVTDEMLDGGAAYAQAFGNVSPRAAELFRQVGMRSLLTVPLVARQRSLGVLSLGRIEQERPYTPSDVSVAEDLGRRCAMAVDSSLLYRSSQAAIQTRDEFLSIASHELRTPLTSLLLRLEGFERSTRDERALDVRQLQSSLGVIHRQAKRLNALVEQLLDVARLRRGFLELDREQADLSEILRDVCGRFAGNLSNAGCPITISTPAPVMGCWDRIRMEQVITNLLSNAIKFAQSSAIDAGVDVDADVARLYVRDRGMGIPPADQERIFERFERTDTSKHFGGLGLGLYITRQIVEAHGGTIRVTSNPGQGSTFIVKLPRTQ